MADAQVAAALPADSHLSPGTEAEPASARAWTMVAIHGVGDAEPGVISRGLAQTLQANDCPDAYFERADLLIRGSSYPRLKAKEARLGNAQVDEIIEVNWSDVLRPADSVSQVLRHLFHIVIGMRHLSVQPVKDGATSIHTIFPKLFWASIEWSLWWVAYVATSVMLITSCGPGQAHWKLAVAVSAPLGAAAMAWALGRYSKGFHAGWLWAVAMAAIGLDLLRSTPSLSTEKWIHLSGVAYGAAQGIMGVTLIVAYLELHLRLRKQPIEERSARAALLWLPFVVVCAVGAGSWAASLLVAQEALGLTRLEAWQHSFLHALHYDLLWAELGTLSAVLLIFGALPLVGAGAYAFEPLRRLLGLGETAGEAVHKMIAVTLRVGPILLILGGFPFWHSLTTGTTHSGGWTVFDTYSLSASRIALLVPFLIPVARVMLDCAGDVIFHLLPESLRISSRAITRARLRGLLENLRKRRPENEVVILAHSQGSVIAWEALREEPDLADRLATIGSPLTTLYGTFLGGEFGQALPAGTARWRNLFFSGDYIGGKVAGCPDNHSLGPGGHTGYWTDERVIGLLAD